MLKIMHVITDLHTGGAEMMLWRLLKRSTAAQHSVVSLLSGGALKRYLIEDGFAVDEMGMRLGRASLGAGIAVARAAHRDRPDLLQGWMYHGNIAAALAHVTSLRRVPLLWSVHHSLHDPAREKRLTRYMIGLGGRLSRLTSGIVYVSKASARQHETLGYDPDKTVIIPNGIDCNLFRPRAGAGERLRSELGIGADVAVIGMVAGHRPMKDHGNLLRAASILRERIRIRLVLIGPGVDSANSGLVEQIARTGLTQEVSLLGERHDVPDLMPGFDVAVLPSAWGEAFPLVLCEAMASGVPCVATDIGDSRWIVGDTGASVPPRDPAALAQALAQMVELGTEGMRRLGERARARVVQHWALAEIVHRYQSLYEEVARPRSGN